MPTTGQGIRVEIRADAQRRDSLAGDLPLVDRVREGLTQIGTLDRRAVEERIGALAEW